MEFGEHARHLGGAAVGIGGAAVGVEALPGVLETDGVADRDDMQFGEDLTELFDSAESAGYAAVGDEGDRLGVPFFAGGIDQFFQSGGIAVVVFRCDDDESIGSVELGPERAIAAGPMCRPFVFVTFMPDRSAVRDWIDHFDAEVAACSEFLLRPSRDGIAEAALAGASVN